MDKTAKVQCFYLSVCMYIVLATVGRRCTVVPLKQMSSQVCDSVSVCLSSAAITKEASCSCSPYLPVSTVSVSL